MRSIQASLERGKGKSQQARVGGIPQGFALIFIVYLASVNIRYFGLGLARKAGARPAFIIFRR